MRKTIRTSIKATAVALFGFGALSFASSASACGSLGQPPSWQPGGASQLLHNTSVDNPGNHAIVGMWSFQMTAGGGTVDFGYQQWHSDGTELLNSGGRAPATENFCMGVWRQVGPSKYHLNHFALSYDSSGTLNAKVNIKEDVTINANGTSYSGPFSLDVYDPNSGTLLQHVAGQVTAHRITAN